MQQPNNYFTDNFFSPSHGSTKEEKQENNNITNKPECKHAQNANVKLVQHLTEKVTCFTYK